MLEILIRENGGEPKWVATSEVLGIIMKKKPKTSSPSPPTLIIQTFDRWYNLYNKKTTKKQAQNYFYQNIRGKDLFKIMKHTKQYIKSTEKKFRLDPIRYLRNEKFNDEIIEQEKTYELKEYPRDKTDFPRAWCSKCEKIDTYYEWEIKKGSKCCNMATLLPFDPKITKRKYD